jgi:hypothetical protein
MRVDNNLRREQYGAPPEQSTGSINGRISCSKSTGLGVEFPAKSRRQSMAIVLHAEAHLSLADSVPCLQRKRMNGAEG